MQLGMSQCKWLIPRTSLATNQKVGTLGATNALAWISNGGTSAGDGLLVAFVLVQTSHGRRRMGSQDETERNGAYGARSKKNGVVWDETA